MNSRFPISNRRPPHWADRFLEWYCRPDLLEEIQGDAHELFYREVKKNKRKAQWQFVWNVIRFFRWRNIRKKYSHQPYFIDMLRNFLTVSLRHLSRKPGYTLLHITGLAVSFTAALLIGLWVAHEKSFDQFHHDADRIFQVMSHVDADGDIQTYSAARASINLTSVPDVVAKSVVITGTRWPNELCFRPEGKAQECIYLKGIFSDSSFFKVFNFPLVSGSINPLVSPDGIAVSEDMARFLYGTENPLGKILKIDDHYPVKVATVFKNVPTNSTLQFHFILPVQVFAQMRGLSPEYFQNDFFSVYIKTNTSVTAGALTAKLNAPGVLTEDLRNDKLSYRAYPLSEMRLRGEFTNGKPSGGRIQYVNLFMLVALVVVSMAVINFINLSTARAANRAKEVGIRKVTGAMRSSIVVQFVGESFLLVFTALALALMSAYLMLPFFNLLIGDELSIRLFSADALIWIAAFLGVVSLAAGLYPAVMMAGFHPIQVLKGGFTRSGSATLRKALLIVQIGASIGIVIFTSVLFRQMAFIQNKNLGLDSSNLIHIEPTYRLLKHYAALENELLSHPQLTGVAATQADPIDLTVQTTGVSWPGMPEGMNAPFKLLAGNPQTPTVFGIGLVEGRFPEAEPRDSLHTEVVLSESAVKRMNLAEPLGTLITIGNSSCIIIGVMNDFHTGSLRQEQVPVIFYAHPILHCSRLYVRYKSGATHEALRLVEEAYKKIEPDFTMKYAFVDEAFGRMYKTEKTASVLLTVLTGISLVIAVIGVVGLASFTVEKKKKEISVKRVFGATVAHVLGMLSREFLMIVLFASAIALPFVGWATHHWLSGFAYRIDLPWWVFVLVCTGTALLTLLLLLLQGMKTIRANPAEILRSE